MDSERQSSNRKDTKLRSGERKNVTGGRAAAGGFDFHAEAAALIAAKILAKQTLNWIDAPGDRIPEAIEAETGTGGDDVRITLSSSYVVDLQLKKGLQRGPELWQALIDLATAIETNSNVYGILLTNTSASGSIRNELKDAIERIGDGRTEKLPEIATDFIKKLTDAGINDLNTVCKRLRIRVRDFEPGSPGEEETFAALRVVLADATKVGAARNTLVSESHDLIQRRGRLDVTDIARKLSQAGLELSKAATNPLVVQRAFLDWSESSNESFVIPTLRVALPIERAWITLRAMDEASAASGTKPLSKQIEEYQEWHRLAQAIDSDDIVNVETAVSSEQAIVVVGGPGAGKSTLTRRLTWQLARRGEVGLRVSLRGIATRLRNGESFDDALRSAIANRGFSRSSIRALLSGAPVTLLGDGLDETDPDRAIVATQLKDWVLADKTRRAIVTTRPVGHNPAWFEGWRHLELLPLTDNDIKKLAQDIYRLLFPTDTSHADREAERFLQDVKKSRTASFAARNPQLLGLLIALHVSGTDVSGNRYQLFDKAVELIRQQPSGDRVYRYELPLTTARRTLEIIGWQLLNNPAISRNALIQRVGGELEREMNQPVLVAHEIAERALGFWEERGLLEQLTAGGESASVFIHLSFRDQAAASYLSKLAADHFVNWVSTAAASPAQRETLLLTGATPKLSLAIEALLKDDDVNDPISTVALLAADVLAESESATPEVTTRVIQHLLPRLTSSVPLVAHEAAEKLRPLALVCPNLIGPLARSISRHNSKWAREVGCGLALLCGEEYVEDDALLETYSYVRDTELKPIRGGGVNIETRPLMRDVLVKGAEYLLKIGRPDHYPDIVIERVEKGNFSSGAWEEVLKLIEDRGLTENISGPKIQASAFAGLGAAIEEIRQTRLRFYTATGDACDDLLLDGHDIPAESQSNCLAKLYETLQIGKTPIDGFDEQYSAALTEIVRCAIVAANLNPAQLKSEAQAAKAQLEKADESISELSAKTEFSVKDVDWSRARSIEVNPTLVFQAVASNIRFLAMTAARIALNAVNAETLHHGFEEALRTGSGFTLRLTAHIAKKIWGSRATEVLLHRLEHNLTGDCGPLIEKLGELVIEDNQRERVRTVLAHALTVRSVPLVESAMKTVVQLNLEAELRAEVRESYEYWLRNGPPGPKETGVVPANAASALLTVLVEYEQLNFEELRETLRLANERDRSELRPIAIAGLTGFLKDDEHLRTALSEIGDGTLPAEIIYELAKTQPQTCRERFEDILSILQNGQSSAKIACIRILGDGIFDVDTVRPVLTNFLQFDDPTIRDEAVAALRRLR